MTGDNDKNVFLSIISTIVATFKRLSNSYAEPLAICKNWIVSFYIAGPFLLQYLRKWKQPISWFVKSTHIALL